MSYPGTHDEWRTSLEASGYTEVPEAEVVDGTVKAGDRVRNYGEQYPDAYLNGTARVVALYQRGSHIEVIAQRDRDPEGECSMPWQNYRTVAVPPNEARA